MTKKTNTAVVKERRTGTKDLVNKLLTERKEMWSLFYRNAGLAPFGGKKKAPQDPKALLQEFCQILVDYIAAGHFSLYERIINGRERRREVAELAAKLYPRIAETTNSALEFNDKYDAEKDFDITDELHDDLSRIGQELANRIELEDQIISALISGPAG